MSLYAEVTLTCEDCGVTLDQGSPSAVDAVEELLDTAREVGWYFDADIDQHWCAECFAKSPEEA